MKKIAVLITTILFVSASLSAYAQSSGSDYIDPGPGGFDGGENEGGGVNNGDDGSDYLPPGNGNGSNTPTSQPPETEVRTRWEPTFYLDFDFSSTITNLNVPTTDHHENSNSGYRVVNSGRLEFGVGPHVEWYYENATGIRSDAWGIVGLIPIVGSSGVEVRHVGNLEDARKIYGTAIEPVRSLEEIKSWAIGDSKTYLEKGGLLAIAGLGVGWIGLTGSVLAQGSWSVHIERMTADDVAVKITRNEVTQLATAAGSVVVSVGVSNFRSADDGFSFIVKLNGAESPKIFSDLIRGNVAVAQIKASEGSRDVSYTEVAREIRKGHFQNFFLGIPLLANAQWNKGHIRSLSKRDLRLIGAKAEAHYGVFSRQHRVFLFGQSRWRSQSFYGAKYKVTSENQDLTNEDGYFGMYSWITSDTDSNQWKLSSALRSVVRQTGVKEILVNIPPVENLESASFNFSVPLSRSLTDKLIDRAKGLSKSEFIAVARALHGEYFKSMTNENIGPHTDPLDICSEYSWNAEYCKYTTDSELKSAMGEMWKSLHKMDQVKSNPKAFTRAYAQFGEGMSTNAFTFQAVLAIAGAGVPLNLNISGTHIEPYGLGLATTDKPGELIVVRTGPEPAKGTETQFPATSNRGLIFGPGESAPPVIVPTMPPTLR